VHKSEPPHVGRDLSYTGPASCLRCCSPRQDDLRQLHLADETTSLEPTPPLSPSYALLYSRASHKHADATHQMPRTDRSCVNSRGLSTFSVSLWDAMGSSMLSLSSMAWNIVTIDRL
jgi:hypothetical protein